MPGSLFASMEAVIPVAGGTTTGAKCTHSIALTLTFNGNAAFNFGDDCAGTAVRGIGIALVRLVE